MVELESDAETAHAVAVAQELRSLLGKLTRRLRDEASAGDFTPSQKSVLSRLEASPATLADLARAEGMRPQSMKTNVSVLEAAGLVEGTPDPTDGRQILLSLTAQARQDLVAARAARQDWLARTIRSQLSSGELDRLAESLELLKRIVGS